MKRKKAVLAVFVVVLLGAQAVPVHRTNPPVTGEIAAPPDVQALLERSCYDCHSNETAWPWYARVAPMSWLVTHDVKEAREHVNFSEWGDLDAGDRESAMKEIAEEVEDGKMPLRLYVPLHPAARLTEAERAQLVAWSSARARKLGLPEER